MPLLPRARGALALFATILALGIILVWYLNYESGGTFFDATYRSTVDRVTHLEGYTMTDMTAARVSGKTITISGIYRLDYKAGRYASYSTTTLPVTGLGTKSAFETFSVDNIAIGRDVYVRIMTNGAILRKNIPNSPSWHIVTPSASAPSAYARIAVAGPILDNLAIFTDNGRYLSEVARPSKETLDGVEVRHYVFGFTDEARKVTVGTMPALVGHVGTGTVDVWIEPKSASVVRMRFVGDAYVSTSTIESLARPVDIEAPHGADE